MKTLLLAALLLAGCGPTAATEEYNVANGNGGVYEFRLKDGTRCVHAYRGGVDCDWRGR
jgi:hypothetical protein